MSRRRLTFCCLLLASCGRGNTPREAPTELVSASSAPSQTTAASAVAATSVPMSPPPTESAASAAPVAKHSSIPELQGADGGVLEQTEERPSTHSEWFQRMSADLFRAIVTDDPALARPVFFPIVAYRRVKAVTDPDRDYNRRLIAAFERDIHDYHQKLGTVAQTLSFIALDVDESRARWMAPGSEGNRLGYFRVLRSRLRYKTAAGRENALEVTSLISWRGEWYVVHLNGFK